MRLLLSHAEDNRWPTVVRLDGSPQFPFPFGGGPSVIPAQRNVVAYEQHHLHVVGNDGPPAPDLRGTNGKPNAVLIGKHLVSMLLVMRVRHELRIYEHGIYSPGVDAIKTAIFRAAGDDGWSPQLERDVLHWLRQFAPELPTTPGTRYLVFANRTADLDTGQLVAHSPDHHALYRVNAQIGVGADTTDVEAFFESMAAPGFKRRLIQLGAYALTPWRDPQAIGFVIGPPGSGKSTYARVLSKLLDGPGLVSAVSPHSLASSRFSLAAMEHALLNITGDASRSDVASIATMKGVSGLDTMMIERKGQDPYAARLHVFLLIMANRFPAMSDTEGALLRRMKVAETRCPDRADPGLTDRLTSPENLSAFAAVFLKELWELREAGQFDENDATTTALARFHRETNIVPMFVDETCIFDPDFTVPRAALWEAFKTWSVDARKGTKLGRSGFYDALDSDGRISFRKSNGIDVAAGLRLAGPQK